MATYVNFILLVVFSVAQGQQVAEECLGCLCQALTGCNLQRACAEGNCGMYAITRPFWIDAGRPTKDSVSLPPSIGLSKLNAAYRGCVMDLDCASNTIQQYMTRFQKDCNKDGIVDCWDHAAIHFMGPSGCEKPLPHHFSHAMHKCLDNFVNNTSDILPIDWRMGSK